jgi:hypothetical protein
MKKITLYVLIFGMVTCSCLGQLVLQGGARLNGGVGGAVSEATPPASDCNTVAQTVGVDAGSAVTYGNAVGETYYATRFQAGSDYSICSFEGWLKYTGSPSTEGVRPCLWSDSTSVPGTLLSIGTNVLISTCSSTTNWNRFYFTNTTSLTSGTYYWIGMWHTNVTTSALEWARGNVGSTLILKSTNNVEWNAESTRSLFTRTIK